MTVRSVALVAVVAAVLACGGQQTGKSELTSGLLAGPSKPDAPRPLDLFPAAAAAAPEAVDAGHAEMVLTTVPDAGTAASAKQPVGAVSLHHDSKTGDSTVLVDLYVSLGKKGILDLTFGLGLGETSGFVSFALATHQTLSANQCSSAMFVTPTNSVLYVSHLKKDTTAPATFHGYKFMIMHGGFDEAVMNQLSSVQGFLGKICGIAFAVSPEQVDLIIQMRNRAVR
jgi:hypothetical protein